MYIISIYDNYPDGDRYTSVPKITRRDATQYVVDVMQTKYRSTNDANKRIEVRNLIECVSNGDMSMISNKEYTVAYDIVTRDEWESNKKKEIDKTKQEIERLQKFIAEKKSELARLETVGHL